MFYLYESHTGEFYTTNYELTENELYCNSCCDSDELISIFNTENQLKKLLKKANVYQDYIFTIINEWVKIKNEQKTTKKTS